MSDEIEKIICCDKCQRPLWSLTILSYDKGKRPGDEHVNSTKWVSLHPEIFTGPPKTFNCYLCDRPYVHNDPATKRQGLVLADLKTGARKFDWITGPT